jgi:hypothetical protein
MDRWMDDVIIIIIIDPPPPATETCRIWIWIWICIWTKGNKRRDLITHHSYSLKMMMVATVTTIMAIHSRALRSLL